MGVIGLTTFVDNHPRLLSDHRLHDDRVLIDGNNLYYFLYYNYFNINIRYGGDYDDYANNVRYYFNALKSCNIAPYVILDGGYDTEDKKLKTTIKRQHSRLKNVQSLARGQKGQVFPLLANEVFRQVLSELDVPVMTCDFEADDQLASLAKRWNCPVMSNDSDFFIYDLPAGFIIFDYLDLAIQSCSPGQDQLHPGGYSYLNVQIYKLANLKHYYKGLSNHFMPIFATLMGNDFVDGSDFENFFARVKLPKVGGSGHTRMAERQQKMAGVLMWLTEQETVEKTSTYIINSFPDSKRKEASGKLSTSIRSYTDLASHQVEYFDTTESGCRTRSKLQTAGGNPMPHWIVSGLRLGEIPVFIINTLTLQRNLLLPQVELVTEPCAYTCSRSIRVIIYSILLTLDNSLNKTQSASNNVNNQNQKDIKVQEYHRSKSDLTCDYIEGVSELPDGSAVPYLQKIPHMSHNDRAAIFWAAAGMEKSAFVDLPEGLHLVLAAVCYWVRHATPKISPHCVYVLVACIIRLMLVCKTENIHADDNGNSVQTSDRKQTGDNAQDESDETKPLINDIVASGENSVTLSENHESSISSTDCAHGVTSERDMLHEKVDSYPVTHSLNLHELKSVLLTGCSEEEIESAREKTSRFTIEMTHNSTDNRFHTLITHNFNQFQTCLLSLMHLNMLLLQPLVKPQPAVLFNGTFLYNLCLELQRRTHPKTYICEQFGTNSKLSGLYLKIVDTIFTLVPADAFLRLAEVGKKKKKKKSKSKKAEPAHSEESGSDTQESESIKAKCKLRNRFSGLCLDND